MTSNKRMSVIIGQKWHGNKMGRTHLKAGKFYVIE